MEPKVNYTLVGLFVILIAAGGLWGISFLRGTERGKVYDRYDVFMRESVSGLAVDAPVKYRGVQVGHVSKILLNPKNPEEIQVVLGLERGTPVKEDTIAILTTQGLTGIAFIDLTNSSRESPPLVAKPGQPDPVIKSGPSLFMRLDDAVSGILNGLHDLTSDLRTLMGEENRRSFRQILSDVSEITSAVASRRDTYDVALADAADMLSEAAKATKDLNEKMPEILDKISKTVSDISDVATETKSHIPEVMEELKKSANAMQEMSREIAGTSKSLGTVVTSNQKSIDQFSNQTLTEIGLLVSELRELTTGLQHLARQLEREPEAILFGPAQRKPGPGEKAK